MHGITDDDRKAAEELRAMLADISGFWHRPGDDGPLCVALARYRAECEQRLVAKLRPLAAMAAQDERDKGRMPGSGVAGEERQFTGSVRADRWPMLRARARPS